MIFPCSSKPITCPCSENPFGNLSSEAPDAPVFIGTGFGPFDPPPLGGTFDSTGCLAVCQSTVSQADADQCAENQSEFCTWNGWTPGGPGGGGGSPVQSFGNTLQQCAAICPDNSLFTWTILPGQFFATSQVQADSIARSEACTKADALYFCLGPVQQVVCANQPISVSIPITGANQGPFGVTVTDGALPDGLVLSQGPTNVVIEGTATSPGTSTFTLSISDNNGNNFTKTYTMNVLGLTDPAQLPSGTNGAPYSYQFHGSGGIGPYTYQLSIPQQSPALPCSGGSGFTAAGLFTCTPTQNGNFQLVVTVTDSKGNACAKAFDWIVGFCNTPKTGTGTCPNNPLLSYTTTIGQGAFCGNTQLQADQQAEQALINAISQGLTGLGCGCSVNVSDLTNGVITAGCNTTLQVLDTNGHVIGCLSGNGVGVYGLTANVPFSLQAAWNIGCAGNINVPCVVSISGYPPITFAFGN